MAKRDKYLCAWRSVKDAEVIDLLLGLADAGREAARKLSLERCVRPERLEPGKDKLFQYYQFFAGLRGSDPRVEAFAKGWDEVADTWVYQDLD